MLSGSSGGGQPENVDSLVADPHRQLLCALPRSGDRLLFELQYLIAQGGRLFELQLLSSLPHLLLQVQDEAAQLVTLHLNPQSDETILDACAGLGGKTGHIAQMMKNSGRLVAMDKDENKLMRLESEMHRLGVSIVTTRIHDLSSPLNREHFGKFDRILLDAPCSGLGVLRRNPDIKWRASQQNLAYCQKRQALFLDNLAHFVKPSGILVYAVCSMEPEENESVIKGFLNKHAKFAIEKKSTGLSFNACSLVTIDGYLKTFPHLNNMDGFFSAGIKRIR